MRCTPLAVLDLLGYASSSLKKSEKMYISPYFMLKKFWKEHDINCFQIGTNRSGEAVPRHYITIITICYCNNNNNILWKWFVPSLISFFPYPLLPLFMRESIGSESDQIIAWLNPIFFSSFLSVSSVSADLEKRKSQAEIALSNKQAYLEENKTRAFIINRRKEAPLSFSTRRTHFHINRRSINFPFR